MITLISRWRLRAGCPDELVDALAALALEVRNHEPDTLLYTVHLPAPDPLDPHGTPRRPAPLPIPRDRQKEVVFVEMYRDVAAFARHVDGPTFTRFRTEFLSYFVEDPLKPGWPLAETPFLERLAGFVRPGAG